MIRWLNEPGTTALDPKIEFRTEGLEHLYSKGFLDESWWVAVLELRNTSIAAFLSNLEELSETVRVPRLYSEAERQQELPVQFVAVYVQRAFIRAVNSPDRGLLRAVQGMTLGTIVPEVLTNANDDEQDDKPIDVTPGTVVMGVIDSGIAFGHELFRHADNTARVHAAWLMDLGPCTGGLPQQRRLSKHQIDQALSDNMHSGLLDEDGFYREVGLIDFRLLHFKPASLRVSHGTHVMSLAAGYYPAEAPATRPIVCVQLPTHLVRDPSGTHLFESMWLALAYIERVAHRFRFGSNATQQPPLVVNFSFGNYSGPHDSTGLIARALDHWCEPAVGIPEGEEPMEKRLLLPAGNGNLQRCHAAIAFKNGFTRATLNWRVQPDDRSASYVELWMPWRPAGADTDLVSVTVQPPNGPECDPVGMAFGEARYLEVDGVIVGRITFTKAPAPTDRGVVTICIYPTYSDIPEKVLSPSGDWKIKVSAERITSAETVQCWIARDETLPGFPPFGRQSYFDNECYARFDARGAPLPVDPLSDACIVRRAGTLSGFATASLPAVLAGYVRSDLSLADYSAAGPITPIRDTIVPVRDGPDAAAPSDDSHVLHGVIGAGSRSGSMVAMNGTSVAAPQAARWVAKDVGEVGGQGDRHAIWQAGADGHNPGSTPCANRRIGGGMMNLPARFGANRKPP